MYVVLYTLGWPYCGLFKLRRLPSPTEKEQVGAHNIIHGKYLASHNEKLFFNFQFSIRMYYVSMSNSTNITDSTSKIEKITRHVLELKKEDPNVKIVIFSQWKDILFHLQTAFTMNDISYRSNSHRFYETIREFKVRVSKFMFPHVR